MEITFAIVGSDGTNDDANRLSRQHFDGMVIIAEGLLEQFAESNYKITTLVSGGGAFADHSCVKLFLNKKVPNLRLYLPCEFEGGSFVNNPPNKIPYPEGATHDVASILNHYHKKFQLATHINSLSEIQIAKFKGAELLPCKGGFYDRNVMISKSDFLLAMTFGNGAEIKSGGTCHTVKCYLERVRKEGIFDKSYHYDLNTGKLYMGCVIPHEKNETFKKEIAHRFQIPLHQIVAAHSSP